MGQVTSVGFHVSSSSCFVFLTRIQMLAPKSVDFNGTAMTLCISARVTLRDEDIKTANSKQQTANSKQQTANSKQQTARISYVIDFMVGHEGFAPSTIECHIL